MEKHSLVCDICKREVEGTWFGNWWIGTVSDDLKDIVSSALRSGTIPANIEIFDICSSDCLEKFVKKYREKVRTIKQRNK